MYRPPFEEWAREQHGGQMPIWYHVAGYRERWLAGDGDRPLYHDESE